MPIMLMETQGANVCVLHLGGYDTSGLHEELSLACLLAYSPDPTAFVVVVVVASSLPND
jgi:hypothetical protein